MICAFAVIFVAIELPIRLSFPLNVDEKVYLIGEWVLTIFFSVDIAIVFVTAFEDEEGELFIDPLRVALRYARTWLIVDVIGKRIPSTLLCVFVLCVLDVCCPPCLVVHGHRYCAVGPTGACTLHNVELHVGGGDDDE